MAANPNPSEPEHPAPDPGNSPPEDWTEDLDPAELTELAERLQRESDT